MGKRTLQTSMMKTETPRITSHSSKMSKKKDVKLQAFEIY